MTPPKKNKQVREFLGLVNYYRDMWDRCSHLLQPLTSLTSNKVTYKWSDILQKALDDINNIFACNTLLAYLDFNKWFYIYTDASDFQIRSVIRRGDKPISFYSRKLAVM